VVEQERHGLVDVRWVDDVVVVESQHGRPGEFVEIVDQADQHGLRRKHPVAVRQRQRVRTHLGAAGLDGRDEVRDEPAQLAVPGIERQPRHARRRRGPLIRRQPLREQSRLAEPGRRRHQDEPRHRRRPG
jgi:hypothetical protein